MTVAGKPTDDKEAERAAGVWLRASTPEVAAVRLVKMTA